MNGYHNVVRLLENAGFIVKNPNTVIDDGFVYLEDPSCVLRAFENFLEYAWVAIAVITGGLIMGWGISMIRGAKNAVTDNFKTLILIFGILTAMWPILNVVYGGNLIGAMCKTKKVSIENVNMILSSKPQNAGSDSDLYEDIDIYDSGPGGDFSLQTSGYTDLDRFMDEYEAMEDIGGGAAYISTGTVANNNGVVLPVAANAPSGIYAYVKPDAPGEIYYVAQNGAKYVNIGGSLTWRANNPGALRSSKLTKRMGEIGITANGFAIFPNESVGRSAQIALLKTPNYQNKTIRQAINIYAPASDGNNPQSYAARVARELGVSVDTPMRNLSENQLTSIVMVIRRIEGWRAGTTKNM